MVRGSEVNGAEALPGQALFEAVAGALAVVVARGFGEVARLVLADVVRDVGNAESRFMQHYLIGKSAATRGVIFRGSGEKRD